MRFQNGNWKTISGAGLDIGIGADNTPYVIGTDNAVWKFSYTTEQWTKIGGNQITNVAGGPDRAWGVDSSNVIWRQSTQRWVQLSGSAKDISVGVDGSVYVLGQDTLAGGSGVWKYLHTAKTWTRISDYHGGVRIATDPQGNPWIVDQSNLIWAWNPVNQAFTRFPGAATDIGIGADGSIWVIGIQAASGGYNIRTWDSSTSTWNTVGGAAVRISVQPNGIPWVINSANNIFRWNGKAWTKMAGQGVDIGISPAGTIYIIGTDGNTYKWVEETSTWYKVSNFGNGAQISADSYGNPWTVADVGTISAIFDDAITYAWPADDATANEKNPYNFQETDAEYPPQLVNWQVVLTSVLDIGVGPDGNVWYTGTDKGIYQWSETNLAGVRVTGAAEIISVGPNNIASVINSNKYVYIWQGSNWRQLPSTGIDVGFGADGSLFIIGAADNRVYQWNEDQLTWNKFVAWDGDTPARISVDKNGRPWVVGKNGYIARWIGNRWQNFPGSAIDIGHSVDGSVWVIGSNNAVFRWSWNQQSWIGVGGANLHRIAADPSGVAWAVSTSNTLSRLSTLKWQAISGAGNDIGAGPDGSVYVIGKDSIPGGNGVWRYLFGESNWARVSAYHGAVAVAADRNGNPWIVDANQVIRVWNDETKKFDTLPDGATDIASGADGSIWIIGIQAVSGGFNIRKWDPEN